MYLSSFEKINMVGYTNKFLLKEKDSKGFEPFPLSRFFCHHKFNIFFKNQHTQHPMSSQNFVVWRQNKRYSSLF